MYVFRSYGAYENRTRMVAINISHLAVRYSYYILTNSSRQPPALGYSLNF